MQRSELVALVGDLTTDPNHDRYSTTAIYTELDNSQRKWNIAARILKDTVILTVVDGTRQYALSGLTGTPIAFPRVTHKGIDLDKVDKSWLDLYTSRDWTVDTGTPRRFLVETSDPDVQYLTVHPTPTGDDAGDNLVAEYIKDHTAMASDSDQPFNASPLLVPYHWGLAYDTASRLLIRDPNQENAMKGVGYGKVADSVMSDVIQVFKALEREEPLRLRGGRRWRY